ncbi:MAG: MoxR family ATPase [Planctomycetota bacterium]|nr:MAG: MoxR family ATPase [Planctomycetota bacterium]
MLDKAAELVQNIEQVIRGKRETVSLAVTGLLAGGHVLLEDVPGTGKTTLARALARSVAADFRRIQFTSDLLPSDVLGVNIYSQQKESFVFTPGPVFGNIVLADELNRSSPRTQSSLLESMNEGRVSIDGNTRDLPQPFFVIATQNPLEFEGTYPLPESQLDRFLLRLAMGYPDRDTQRAIIEDRILEDPIDRLKPIMTMQGLLELMATVPKVRVEESLVEYLLDLVETTRQSPELAQGASPRGALGLFRASQAFALVQGRNFVVPDDVKFLFIPALAHRVLPAPEQDHGSGSSETILKKILQATPVPR